ncbi:MAG TPA: DUF2097 domain-containing protein [Methanobacteriaceae archaeon]|nr:DUF2097 domain-containing protein [Methanobacteriaceae archaeon]
MVKNMTMDCEEAIEYIKTNVKTYDNVELSYNRVFTPGEVINIDTCVLRDGKKSCTVMVNIKGDTLSTTVDVDLEEIKYDLIEVRHIPQEGEEILIVIDACEEDFE